MVTKHRLIATKNTIRRRSSLDGAGLCARDPAKNKSEEIIRKSRLKFAKVHKTWTTKLEIIADVIFIIQMAREGIPDVKVQQ